MHCEALLESLIQSIYRAAGGTNGWTAFLASFGGALCGIHPSLYLADTSDRSGSLEISVGMDDEQRLAYGEYYVRRNLWIKRARPFLRPGTVRASDQLCSRREFLRSEWYADYCRPLGWTRGIGATVLRDGTVTANIGAFRGNHRPEFGEEDFGLLRELMPHLQRGLKLYRQLAVTRAHGQALEAILHGLSTPTLLVAQNGIVLFMNAAAERLIRASDGLAITAGQLRALLPGETASLAALIGKAAGTSAGRGRGSGGNLQISRPHGRGPLELLISPLPALHDDWLLRQPAVAAIFVTDRSSADFMPDRDVMRLHGLTASETRVATAIVQGLAGKEICRALGISYNTLKTHLKHIYAKTRTRHQSELVRLLATGLRVAVSNVQDLDG
jgi:DNA-binding CsgD family transcriptional regulator